MHRVIVFICCVGAAVALSDVNKECIAENSEPKSNDFLIGSWYYMYKLSLMGGMVPMPDCKEDVYTRPTAELVQEYKNKYNDPDLPYSLDDNPVLRTDADWQGMVTGNNIAKFYVLAPNSTNIIYDGYSVAAYRPLDDKYMMYTECARRGHIRWLLSRDRYAPVAEMEEVIKNTPELNRLNRERYCATY